MDHDGLAAHLARHLRTQERMVWTDMQMGPAGSARPDVFTLDKSYVHPNPTSYEVKVSRADFLRDRASGKWQSYIPFSRRILFACERGMVKKDEVPQGAGLIVFGESWRLSVAPPANPVTMPVKVLMKLLIDGLSREGGFLVAGDQRGPHTASAKASDAVRRKLGHKVADILRDTDAAERLLNDLRRQAVLLNNDMDQLRQRDRDSIARDYKRLAIAVGVDPAETPWYIREKVVERVRQISGAPAAAELAALIGAMRRLCDSAEAKINYE